MFLKNRNIISKIKRSKVTDYAALNSDTSHLDLGHQSDVFVFSDSAVFDKVSTAIINTG